jgi:hypothetical protein
MAIVKALQAIDTIKINTTTPRTIYREREREREKDNCGVPQKHEKSKTSHRRNQKIEYCIGEIKLEH